MKTSILAGIAVSIGCIVNLLVGGVPGAILFSMGLGAILVFGWNLFTGKVGLLAKNEITFQELIKILIGNFIGVLSTAAAISLTPVGEKIINSEMLNNIINIRLSNGWIENLILGTFCGLLMYVAVFAYKTSGSFVMITFPVAVFILSGFNHCIADMFYFILAGSFHWSTLVFLICVTLGNLIGGSIIHLLITYSEKQN